MSEPKDLIHVHVTQLVVSRNAPHRSPLGDLRVLKNSLLSMGIREPMAVRKIDDSTFQIVSGRGYRRFLALRELINEGHQNRFKWIPVQVLRGGGDIEESLDLLASSLHEPMPVEVKAQAITSLLKSGLPATEIAIMSGMPSGMLNSILKEAGDVRASDLSTSVFDYELPPEALRDRFAAIVANAATLPGAAKKRVMAQLHLLSECLDGRLSPAETALRIAQPDLEPGS